MKLFSFLEIKFQNGAHLKKKGYFWPTFHIIFSHQGKAHKFLQYISRLHTYTYFPYPVAFFLAYQFFKNYEFIMYASFLSDSWCWFFFRAILEQSINNKMVSNI